MPLQAARAVPVAVALGGAALALLGCATPAAPAPVAGCPEVPARVIAADRISDQAHEAIGRRMRRHARQVNELVWATVLVDYSAARQAAQQIAANTDLGTAEAEPGLAAALPRGFLALEAELRARAGKVIEAATVRSARDLSAAYAGLSQVCIDCHAVYRTGPAPGGPRDQTTLPVP
jgi:cytochrome c556